jgi:uncharacterized protein YciI
LLYIIFMEDFPQNAHLRGMLMDQHMDYLRSWENKIVIGGAQLQEDGTTAHGSVMVVNVGSLEEAAKFIREEPLMKAGLYRKVKISRMRRGIWHPENAPTSVSGN